jgi:hypothetical protein
MKSEQVIEKSGSLGVCRVLEFLIADTFLLFLPPLFWLSLLLIRRTSLRDAVEHINMKQSPLLQASFVRPIVDNQWECK